MAISVKEIPELRLLKPSEHFRVFSDFFAMRQGIAPRTPHPVACGMAEKTGDDYSIIALERAFIAARSLSSSDIPALLSHAIRQIPAPLFKPSHRKFCKIDQVQDFKSTEYLSGLDDLPVQDAEESAEINEIPVVFEQPAYGKLKHLRTRLTVSRKTWVNNSKWLAPTANAIRMALYRKEAAMVYAALEAGTPAHTETGATLSDVALAVEKFRALTTSAGELIGAEPKYFICPATVEFFANTQVKASGLNIEVIARSGLTASYLLPSPEQHACLTLQTLSEDGLPLIETNKPRFTSDNVAILDGSHDVNAIFTSGLACVKLTA